jgi:hypothetical protein
VISNRAVWTREFGSPRDGQPIDDLLEGVIKFVLIGGHREAVHEGPESPFSRHQVSGCTDERDDLVATFYEGPSLLIGEHLVERQAHDDHPPSSTRQLIRSNPIPSRQMVGIVLMADMGQKPQLPKKWPQNCCEVDWNRRVLNVASTTERFADETHPGWRWISFLRR